MPVFLQQLLVKKDHQAADCEMYINKFKAEKKIGICLVTGLMHRWLQPLPEHRACSWEHISFQMVSKVGHWAVVQSNLLLEEKNLGSEKCFQQICTF